MEESTGGARMQDGVLGQEEEAATGGREAQEVGERREEFCLWKSWNLIQEECSQLCQMLKSSIT